MSLSCKLTFTKISLFACFFLLYPYHCVLIRIVLSGTKSAPREIVLENSILPKDPGFVRVSTPPRVITLNDHHFPSASDLDQNDRDEEENMRNYYEPKILHFSEETKRGNKSNKKSDHNTQELILNQHRYGNIINYIK